MSKKAENFKSLVKGNPIGSIVTAINMLQSSTRSESFPDVDVHKNSMGTVLYIPESLDHRYVCSVCVVVLIFRYKHGWMPTLTGIYLILMMMQNVGVKIA